VAKVYLETSFVSACVTARTDPGSVHRRQVSLEWWATQRRRHALQVSDEVVTELAQPRYPQRDDALSFIQGIEVLAVTPEVTGLAKIFVAQRVMPAPLAGDAIHVAAATLYGSDYLLSWNVRHLANPNKVRHLATICLRMGVVPPQIVTPDFLWETPNASNDPA
jgi:hypothetical protein